MALVEGLTPEEVGGRASCSGTAFGLPAERGGVVGCRTKGAVVHGPGVSSDVVLGDGPGEFEVRVGNTARRVGRGDDIGLDAGWKGGTPHDGRTGRGEEDAAHPSFGSITGADGCWGRRDNLLDVGGPGAEFVRQMTDVVEEVVVRGGEGNTMGCAVARSVLHCTEEPPEAGDSELHTAQFTQCLVPLAEGDAALAGGNVGEQGVEARLAPCWEADRAGHSVNVPPEDCLVRRPGAVSLKQFFEGDGVLPGSQVGGVEGAEDLVDEVDWCRRAVAWTICLPSRAYVSVGSARRGGEV